MHYGDIACGFVSSPELLAAWPRHDGFNLVKDTRVLFGSLDAYDDPQAFETDELAEKLLAWSQSVLLMQA